MPKRKSRPALTNAQEKEYAQVPITKEDEAKLRAFLVDECRDCKGSGQVEVHLPMDTTGTVPRRCPTCGGSGRASRLQKVLPKKGGEEE